MNMTYTTSYDVWDFNRRTSKYQESDKVAIRFIDLSEFAHKFNGYMLSSYAKTDDKQAYSIRASFFDSIDGLYTYLDSCEDKSLVLFSAIIQYTFITTSVDDQFENIALDQPYIETQVKVCFGKESIL